MSKGKKINESPNIDIGPDTPLLALGADGAVGKGTLPKAGWQKSQYTPRLEYDGAWYRIANTQGCSVGIIAVTENYNNLHPHALMIGFSVDESPAQVSAKVIVGRTLHIDKLRYVADSNNGHLDIHTASLSAWNQANISICGHNITAIPIEKVTDEPSAGQVKEITLTQSGGVICCTAIGPYLVAYKEKGGPHEHKGDNVDKREAEVYNDGRDGRQRIRNGFQSVRAGRFYRLLQYSEPSEGDKGQRTARKHKLPHGQGTEIYGKGPKRFPTKGNHENLLERLLVSVVCHDTRPTCLNTRKEVVAG